MDALYNLMPIFILFGILSSLGWLLRLKYSEEKWFNRLCEQRTVFGILLCWTLFGFLTNLDYNHNWGCMSASEPIFSKENILFSFSSLIFLSLGFLMSSRKIGNVILIFELIFWLYKLAFLKGGYVVGLGGVPSIDVLAFDSVALVLRLIIIKQVYHLPIRVIFFLILAFIIMTLKVQFFR
jgi:hypothetical protein